MSVAICHRLPYIFSAGIVDVWPTTAWQRF